MNYLGIDWGKKRIGLALADNETQLALPFKVVNYLSEVLDIIKKENVDIIVLGKPTKLSNEEFLDPDFNNFYKALQKNTDKKIVLIDERFSTKAGTAYNAPEKLRADKDALAACFILQSYLEQKKYE